MEYLQAWLTLLNVPGVGPTRFRTLIERFGNPEAVLSAASRELLSVPRMDRKTAEAIRTYRDDAWLQKQLMAIEGNEVQVIPFINCKVISPDAVGDEGCYG